VASRQELVLPVAVQVARERNQAVVAFDRFLRDNGLL